MRAKSNFSWEDSKLYYQYINDINKYPLLTKSEEKELLRRIQNNDDRAVNRLVCSNLKFVINVAFMYKGQGFTLPELINEGNIGLIEAARRFDLNKNIRFISYAVWWIRQAITRAIAEKARMVRISAEKELVLRRVNKHVSKMKYVSGGGLQIDAEDLGKRMGYSREKMEKILEMGQYHTSLDTPLDGESGSSLMDMMTNSEDESTDKSSIEKSRNELLAEKLSALSPQEQKVLKMYYGINISKGLSLEDIGELIGLSKERVRQIKEKGLANLRKFELPQEMLLAA